MRAALVGIAIALGLLFAVPAHAGPTGASMGGGSWGSRTAPSASRATTPSFSSSSTSSSSSSSSSSNDTFHFGTSNGFDTGPHYSSGSTGNWSFWTRHPLYALSLLGAVAGIVVVSRSKLFTTPIAFPHRAHTSAATAAANYADVTVLRIALDGRARKFVQTELARIAKVADTGTAAGRATMLRDVALLLRRLKDAWVYGGAVNEDMRDEMAQKAVFDRYVDDARVQFTHETTRNDDGITTTGEAPALAPRSDQGEGLILVTIVIAAHGELFEVATIDDGADLRQALESASHRTTEDLIAIEVIWMPSEDEDRMSSVELEAWYPPPALVPIRGALVGKVFCAYCSGPFPAELVACPHCGAPATGERAS